MQLNPNLPGFANKERPAIPNGVTITLHCEPENTPIKGNCSAIDKETDARCEQWIRRQLRSGNDWAWCCAHVIATHEASGLTGEAWLGCCSYKSQEDFMSPDGYYPQMVDEAVSDLMKEIARMHEATKATGGVQ